MSTVIKIENLSKMYRLGSIGTGTLTHDLNRWIAKLRGKEDPYLKLSQANDRTKYGNSEYVWALKDLNFEVNQGEVLGIVGKNGAGKSTLLKILSRTTTPTTGTFKAKGRIASLLEVGTGFHPELSGRENIFLNGAILGMTKQEIKSKFDEIVAFSGVERYLDTPIKRYSSGMYVRLAFAVAAHLDPEILIVDEVLAVGDQEFQDKCIGKMKDVSKSGRTVLFVSHNMSAVRNLCNKGILMEKGMLIKNGTADEIVNIYLQKNQSNNLNGIIDSTASFVNTGEAKFKTVLIKNKEDFNVDNINFQSPLTVETTFEINNDLKDYFIDLRIHNLEGIILTHSMNKYISKNLIPIQKGLYKSKVTLQNNFQPGSYTITIGIFHENGYYMDFVENIAKFNVLRVGDNGMDGYTYPWIEGNLHDSAIWKIEKLR
jgi:lipopolysaccharide transport system ATP-binding protein